MGPRRLALRRWSAIASALCVLWITPTGAHAQRATGDSVRLTFFDVGQGDATLISTSEGKRVLIDAGPGGAELVSKLTALGVTTIDLVVASHNHADHIGGMADVLRAFTVREYVDNGLPALTSVYRRTVDAVEQTKGLKIRPAGWQRYQLGGVTVHLLAPPHGDEAQNDNSIGLRVQFGRFNALFTGDAERLELEFWRHTVLNNWPRPSVIKASHHGSDNGVTDWWIERLRPKVVVISVGANNQYGHPSKDVLLGWSAVGARVYRTDGFGTITIAAAADGGFTVRTERNEAPWVSK